MLSARTSPEGEQEFGYEHLFPIAKLLIERGHKPLDDWDKYGFAPGPNGITCWMTRAFTDEDWEAIKERFVIPRNIVFYKGLIRDNDNEVDMLNYDEIHDTDGTISADEWESRQAWSGLPT